jgi:toxin ParE1/3/4
VAKVRFSRRAEADFVDIAAYTLLTWDADQADRYLTLLDDYCKRLADTPVLGRACDHICPGLLRAEQAGHVVFFRRELTGIVLASRCFSLGRALRPEVPRLQLAEVERSVPCPRLRAIRGAPHEIRIRLDRILPPGGVLKKRGSVGGR